MLVGDSFVSTVKLDNNNDSDDEKKHPSSKVTRSVWQMEQSFILNILFSRLLGLTLNVPLVSVPL